MKKTVAGLRQKRIVAIFDDTISKPKPPDVSGFSPDVLRSLILLCTNVYVRSCNASAETIKDTMFHINPESTVKASKVGGSTICGTTRNKNRAMYRIMRGNSGKNACACSEEANTSPLLAWQVLPDP